MPIRASLRRVGELIRAAEERSAGDGHRVATEAGDEGDRAGRPPATSSGTACSCTGRSSARASRRSPCCRRGRSSTRVTGSSRCPTSPATTGWSRSTGAAVAGRTGPWTPSAYSYLEFAADTLAVLDATETDRRGARRTLVGCGVGPRARRRRARPRARRRLPGTGGGAGADAPPTARSTRSTSGSTTTEGWAKYNRYHWLEGGYPDFLEFFFAQAVHRAALDQADRGLHRLGPRDRPVDVGRHRRRPVRVPSGELIRAVCERITAPVLVIHGDEDAIQPHAAGAALADDHRRRARHHRRWRARCPGSRPGDRQPRHQALRRQDRPMRARYPDHEGFVERDGVKVAYEVYGEGGPAVFLVPASPITHARSWKGLIPFLSRHLTVVTTDGRGTGRSDRPHERERYGPDEIEADMRGVLDAAGVAPRPSSSPTVTPRRGRCGSPPTIPTWSPGSWPSRRASRSRPGTTTRSSPSAAGRSRSSTPPAGACATATFWRSDDGYRAWVEFFFDQQLPEPHSTKQLEDTVVVGAGHRGRGDDRRAGGSRRAELSDATPRSCAGRCSARCSSSTGRTTAASRWSEDGGSPSSPAASSSCSTAPATCPTSATRSGSTG